MDRSIYCARLVLDILGTQALAVTTRGNAPAIVGWCDGAAPAVRRLSRVDLMADCLAPIPLFRYWFIFFVVSAGTIQAKCDLFPATFVTQRIVKSPFVPRATALTITARRRHYGDSATLHCLRQLPGSDAKWIILSCSGRYQESSMHRPAWERETRRWDRHYVDS